MNKLEEILSNHVLRRLNGLKEYMQMTNSLNDYWGRVDALPTELHKIHLKYWDETGRPNCEMAYEHAVSELLELSNKRGDFIKKHKLLFPDIDVTNYATESKLMLAWFCYVKGLSKLAKNLLVEV